MRPFTGCRSRGFIWFMLVVAAPILGAAQPLSGTLTIGGTSPNYATFTAAVNDLTTRGVNAAVTFNVRPGTYSEQVHLHPIAGSSATNTITFQSQSGLASDVTLEFAQSNSNSTSNYVVLLDSSSHVRLDNLTLVSSGLNPSYRNVVVLNGVISDVIIQGDSIAGSTGSGQNFALISATSATSTNVTIRGNRFGPGSYGVYILGSGSVTSSGTVVKGNTITNPAGTGGILLYYQVAPAVDSNFVTSMSDGINLYDCPGALSIQKNRVRNLSGGNGITVQASSGDALDYGLVANNFVSMDGASNGYALYLSNPTYQKIFYNSVNITATGGSSIGLYLSGGNNILVENNILAVLGGGYAYYVSSGAAVSTSDHNDLYTVGTNYLAYWGGQNAITLADLQGLSGKDANSLSGNPNYTSSTDLHVNSPWVDNAGTPLAEVTVDIDGHPRSLSTPDIGASESASSVTKLAGGTYTIGGTTPNYPTFAAAVNDLVTRGIAGAVTFNVRTGTYTEQVSLPTIAGASATNTITFQSESGVRTDVKVQFTQSDANVSSNYVFWIRGATHVRLLNMTLLSTGLNTNYRTVVEISYTAGDVIIQGDSLSGSPGGGQNLALISGTTATTTNLTIQSNRFGPGGYGIYLYDAPGGGSSGTIIKGNIIQNTAGTGGMYLLYHVAPVVDSNTVSCASDGIDLYGCTAALSIQRNRIVTTNGGAGIQMNGCTGDAVHYGLVANNYVSVEGAANGYAIYLSSVSYQKVFHNSVNNLATAGSSIGLYLSGGNNILVENNILAVLGGGYAYYVSSASAVATSDYNDLYAVGTNYLAYWNGTNAIALADLQGLSGMDIYTQSGNPNYTSSTDLHVNSPWVDNAGTPLAEVTVDIDGHPRSLSTPDIGASESASSVTKLAGGTYTIGGTTPDYPTFTAAVNDLVTRGIAGAVTFNVRTGTYTGQVNLPTIAGASATNTITFQSESGVRSDVKVQFTQSDANVSSNYVFWIRGATHVRLLNMTLLSTGLNTNYRTVLEISYTAGDVIIQGDSLSGWPGGGQSLALISGTSALTNNMTIWGNRFGSAGYGIYLNGGGPSPGTVVKENTISNGAGYGGMYLSSQVAPVVDSNTVSCTNDGIDLYACSAALSLQRNRIMNAAGGTGIQLNSCAGNFVGPGLLANNFVTVEGTSGGTGIYVAQSTFQSIFYNSVNLVATGGSEAIYLSGGSNLKVENNIASNPGGGYAYYVSSASAVATSDYNDLYAVGTNYLALWNGTNVIALADLQGLSGMDIYTQSGNPNYTSSTDLHVNSPWVDNAGTPLAEVTVDIDGHPRSLSTPDIGASESASSVTKLAGGTYTIGGTTPNYPTFTAAVNDLVTRGIAGAVTFNVRTGTYTGQVNLPTIAGASATNTITFQSESGVRSDVKVQFTQSDANVSSNYVFWIRGATHVRLLNMTLLSTGLNTNYRTVLEISYTAGDVIIQGDSLSGWPGSGQNLSLVSGTGSLTTNVAISGNKFGAAGYGIYLNGGGPSPGTVVKGNTISNGAGYGGIYLSSHVAPVVDSNTVSCTNDGIDLYGCPAALSVQRNKVVASAGGDGIQLYACTGDLSDVGLLANNFVTLEGAAGGEGIYIASPTYLNVFCNSVNVVATGGSYALYESGGSNLAIEDNILLNPGGGYACYISSPTAITTSDFDDLYTTGASLAYWGSTVEANLAALRATSGKDSNSVSKAVTFVSTTDLHLAGGSVGDHALRGTPLAGLTIDIDGHPRSTTSPYMGANEASVPLGVPDSHFGGGNGPEQVAREFHLFQNYPNPFNPSTEIRFSVPKSARTTLDIFDVLGQHIATLFDGTAEPGQYYTVTLNGAGLASGVYFYRLQSGGTADIKRMLLLK